MRFAGLIASTAIAFATMALAAPAELGHMDVSLQKRGNVVDFWPRAVGYAPWVHVGCYAEQVKLPYNTGMCSCHNKGWKATPAASELPFNMEKCFGLCKGAGFRYAGIKGDPGAKSCWCGSGVSDADRLASDAKCDKPCETTESFSIFDAKRKYNNKCCGGTKSWSVWRDPCYKKYDPDEAASGYTYVGCFWYQGHILADWSLPASDNLSIEDCVQTCASWGYAYAGLSKSNCMCGGKIPLKWIQRHQITPGDNARCTWYCSMTAKLMIKKAITPAEYQFCGGPDSLSIYKNPDLDVSDNCDAAETPVKKPKPVEEEEEETEDTEEEETPKDKKKSTIRITTKGPKAGTTTKIGSKTNTIIVTTATKPGGTKSRHYHQDRLQD
ncbi:hypothetical protein ABW20_dc0110709 [Dactylellina cionopaga]|nr:hypothetical protein ABW20_dc0110709 [Dactylellina cionopaga]